MSTGATAQPSGFVQRVLTVIERVGNKAPNPVMMFLYLIIGVALLSALLAAFDVTVTEDVIVPVPREELADLRDALGGSIVAYDVYTNTEVSLPEYVTQETTFAVRSLLSVDGLRFVLSSFVDNFAAFTVVAVTMIAMAGVGVAEAAGMMGALIRKLVRIAPPGALAFILVLVGVLTSVATDAGYLTLIPLGAAAYLSVGRHPLAGLAASFAGVSAIFGVNVLITPIDSMVTEITNEAIQVAGGSPITITANYYFAVVSSLILAAAAAIVTTRIIEPQLGIFDASEGNAALVAEADVPVDEAAELRGLRFARWGFLGMLALVLVMTLPPGAPLRDAETGAIIGTTPFMASLIFVISLMFLVCGILYGKGAGTIEGSGDVVGAIGKTFSGLGPLLLMFLMIAQFTAYFN